MSEPIIGHHQLHLTLDVETRELSSGGDPVDQPLTESQRAHIYVERENTIEDACYRANVILHGPEKALRLWMVANQ